MKEIKFLRRSSNKTPVNFVSKTVKTSITIDKEPILSYLNPNNKGIFTISDLNRTMGVLHNLKIKVSSNLSYFNVYVEEGNNSELLKMLVRRRCGWRVVEIPAIANLIWTQFYRKNILKKRITKR